MSHASPFRRLSYEHVAVPGRHNRSTSTSQGSSDMSRFRLSTSRMRTILSFDLISPNSPGRSPSIASGVVCNLPSMNGNRAHLGSSSCSVAAGVVSCALLTPLSTSTANIAEPPTFPDRTSRMYGLALQGDIGSGVARAILRPGRRSTAPHEAPNRFLSGCLDNVSMVQAAEDTGSVCRERAVCPAS